LTIGIHGSFNYKRHKRDIRFNRLQIEGIKIPLQRKKYFVSSKIRITEVDSRDGFLWYCNEGWKTMKWYEIKRVPPCFS
jgi:hypothetical protein